MKLAKCVVSHACKNVNAVKNICVKIINKICCHEKLFGSLLWDKMTSFSSRLKKKRANAMLEILAQS